MCSLTQQKAQQCRLPVDICPSTQLGQSDQPQSVPSSQQTEGGRGCGKKLQVENSAWKQVRCTHRGREGKVCFPPRKQMWSIFGNQMKPGIALHAMVWSSLTASFPQTGYQSVLPTPASPAVRMSPCPKYQAGLTRSNMQTLLVFTCCMYLGLQARSGSERVNLRSFRWRKPEGENSSIYQQGCKKLLQTLWVVWYKETLEVKESRQRITQTWTKGLFRSPGGPSDIKQGWDLPTGFWIR